MREWIEPILLPYRSITGVPSIRLDEIKRCPTSAMSPSLRDSAMVSSICPHITYRRTRRAAVLLALGDYAPTPATSLHHHRLAPITGVECGIRVTGRGSAPG